MKKLINGKVVDIKNMSLFELAEEGLAVSNSTTSNTSDGIEATINSQELDRYITQYNIFFKSLPYPLYAVELDIKYATMGSFIKALNKKEISMWVNHGLNIVLEEESGMIVNIVNNTWGIKYVEHIEEDNTSLELYKDKLGYEDFSWVLEQIMKKGNESYYSRFMPGFTEACNNDERMIAWELENMLTFGIVPNKKEIPDNRVVNVENNQEYWMDIYAGKSVETGEIDYTINLVGRGIKTRMTPKTMQSYQYDVYSKSRGGEGLQLKDVGDKVVKTQLIGMQAVFLTITGIKNSQSLLDFPVYRGIISGNKLAFITDRSLFVTKSNRATEAVEVARDVEFYGVDRGYIYFTKTKRINDRVYKEYLYGCSLDSLETKLCSVSFKY